MISQGDRVRYRGMRFIGTVQSVEYIDGAVSYTVTWNTGETTTVPDGGYLRPIPSQRANSRVEQTLMIIACSLIITMGLLIPILGWVTLVPFGAWALNSYVNGQKRIREQQRERADSGP